MKLNSHRVRRQFSHELMMGEQEISWRNWPFSQKKKDHQWSLARVSSGINTFHTLKQNLAKKFDTYVTEFADNA